MAATWPSHKSRKSAGGGENRKTLMLGVVVRPTLALPKWQSLFPWVGFFFFIFSLYSFLEKSSTFSVALRKDHSTLCLCTESFWQNKLLCSELDSERKEDLHLMKKWRILFFLWLPNKLKFHIGKVAFDNPIQLLIDLLLECRQPQVKIHILLVWISIKYWGLFINQN